MKKQKLDFIKIVIIVVIVIATIISYQSFVSIPKQKIQEQKAKEALVKENYKKCVDMALNDYNENWNLNCDLKGLEKDCNLPLILANNLGDKFQEQKTTICKVSAEMGY